MDGPTTHADRDSLPPVADAPAGNWVDRYAPAAARPSLRLARLDRPIGTWLLLFPCWWSLALAEVSRHRPYPDLWYLVLFAIGALVMRGAGCAYNDFVDRDYDARVQRTRSRPIPSGQVTPTQALLYAGMLALVGFLVLIQLNAFTVWLAIASLALIAIYPFTKRFTYWPQLVLGLVFNWGALVGWAAVKGSLSLAPLALYAGAVLWTVGYDTIYAHQDKEDDLMLGLKSTALKFGDSTVNWLGGLYGGAVLLWSLAAFLAGAHLITFTAIALVALQLAWQIVTLDIRDPANCLRRFRSNRDVGAAIFIGLIADMALSWIAGLS
jgi:4-hydroxybenzoate polyprenyltransferase